MARYATTYATLVAVLLACGTVDHTDRLEQLSREPPAHAPESAPSRAPTDAQGDVRPRDKSKETSARERMVVEQIISRGVHDPRVLDAMLRVPRHEFVPADMRRLAYVDGPLPIGERQTISQPYIVALMTELLRLRPTDRVLEIGTGSGYQTAVLAEVASQVYSIEIIDSLAKRAEYDLTRLGYRNAHIRTGDGYAGWPEEGPFDGIIVTAAAPSIPQPLLDQLRQGARLVIPVGEWDQELRVIKRTPRGFEERREIPVRFVPMTGRAQAE